MSKTVLLIGAFDVKGEEYNFTRKLIEAQGCKTLTMNFGVLGGTDLFPIDIDNAEVAKAGGGNINQLQKEKDRGAAMAIMAKGVAVAAQKLYDEGKIFGVLGLGGSGGTSVITTAMRALPIGVPKVMVSTVASGDTSMNVGVKDVTMIPSIVDVSGINTISEKIFKEAAGAICGMVNMDYSPSLEQKPIITASMFGNTTECVDMCRESLVGKGYEVLVFHCTGTGGKTMEGLVDDGYVYAVLDITTTEWADELCGGVFSAGPSRLSAPGRAGIPHLIVPGCVDMANFGPLDTVPEKFKDRNLYAWNPSVTLMRTTPEENAKMGEIFAKKANEAQGRVAFLLPLKGVSILDSEGDRFWWPEADKAMFDAIKNNVKPGIEVVEMDCNINDRAFAEKAVEMLMGLMVRK
ncbi:MAG: Tm-1-like ATP-binding domain-containing protein [Proteobacteria bacterium]|nr:Tm-1-like ATP-binding domain-containing protein [Pseudomonadota bacterium]MBU1902373.1 Tm-1-like ATP-binding domain-containing protein [Pseudomonadota bacterium]